MCTTGRLVGSGSAWRSTSRVTGAMSPWPKATYRAGGGLAADAFLFLEPLEEIAIGRGPDHPVELGAVVPHQAHALHDDVVNAPAPVTAEEPVVDGISWERAANTWVAISVRLD
jgi:hypothetical protein